MGVGLMAAESFKEHHCVFCVAAFKDVFLVGSSRFGVKHSVFEEEFPGIGLKHLCPKICVVACCISVVAEDVLEIGER